MDLSDVPNLKNLSGLAASERFQIIRDEIRERICFLIYPPDTQLSESNLAAEFGVSRTPVRSVLAQLEAEGLVETHQGVRTKVRQIGIDVLKEEYELRMNLAELAGTMGLLRACEEDIAAFEQILEGLEVLRNAPTIPAYGRINLEIHRQFLKRVKNGSLRNMIDVMYFRTSRIWLSRMPINSWEDEISELTRKVLLMVEMVRTNDSVGIGLLQRNIIFASLDRLKYTNLADNLNSTSS